MVLNVRYVTWLNLILVCFLCLLGNIMTVSLLNLSIDTKLYELFNVLLYHGSKKSKYCHKN